MIDMKYAQEITRVLWEQGFNGFGSDEVSTHTAFLVSVLGELIEAQGHQTQDEFIDAVIGKLKIFKDLKNKPPTLPH